MVARDGSVSAADYGARCDGVTDDAAAFNAAVAAIRRSAQATGEYAWAVGHLGRLIAPRGRCVVRSSLNFTGLYGAGFSADFAGATLVCETNGTPCIDATGLGNATLASLTVQGACKQPPNVGLKVGRTTNDGVGADHNRIVHPTIVGCFTLAAFFNNQSETTLVEHAWFTNQQPSAYAAIWDGANHFNVQSSLTGKSYPPDTYMSFNENTCIECLMGTTGRGSVPIYIGASARHRFINGYAFYSASDAAAPGPAIVLDTAQGSPDFLDLDIHVEDNAGAHNLVRAIEVIGRPHPVLHGLRLRDNYPEQSGPVFARGPGVDLVTIEHADVQLGKLAGLHPRWWDDPAAWVVGGAIYSQDGSYTPPGSFSGQLCVKDACSVVTPPQVASTMAGHSGLEAGVLTIVRPSSGDQITMMPGSDAYYVAGARPMAELTVRLPPLTGRVGQSAELSFAVPVAAVTVEDSAGVAVARAPIAATAVSTRRWRSLGASWVQVQ